MDKDFLRGIKIALGFFFTLSVLFTIVFAVGFHNANEIIGGVFQGNFTVNGTLNAPNIDNNIMVSMYVAMNTGNNSKIKIENGFFDSFNDQTGISLSESINQNFSTNGYYYNSGPIGTEALISQGLGTIIGDYSSISRNFDGVKGGPWSSDDTNAWTKNGGLLYPFVGKDYGGSKYVITGWKAWPTSNYGFDTWANTLSSSQFSVQLQGTNDNTSTWYNVGSAFTITGNDAAHSHLENGNSQAYRFWRLQASFISSGNGDGRQYSTYTEVEFHGYEQTNYYDMNLTSINYSLSSTPAKASITIFKEDINTSATLNTDFIVSISNDGGNTWDLVTLENKGNYSADISIIGGDVSLTGSGTDLKYKIETKNSQPYRIHGVGVTWS